MKIKLIVKDLQGNEKQTAYFDNQKSIDDFKEVLKQGSLGKPEHQRELTPMIHNEDGTITEATYEIVPSEYQVEILDVTAEHEEKARIDNLIKQGEQAKLACDRVMSLISGYNLTRNLTAEQITEMSTLFAPIIQCLMISRPSSAKALIGQVVPDGVLVTEQIKTDILAELVGY